MTRPRRHLGTLLNPPWALYLRLLGFISPQDRKRHPVRHPGTAENLDFVQYCHKNTETAMTPNRTSPGYLFGFHFGTIWDPKPPLCSPMSPKGHCKGLFGPALQYQGSILVQTNAQDALQAYPQGQNSPLRVPFVASLVIPSDALSHATRALPLPVRGMALNVTAQNFPAQSPFRITGLHSNKPCSSLP